MRVLSIFVAAQHSIQGADKMASDNSILLHVRVRDQVFDQLENWRRSQPKIPSRSEAKGIDRIEWPEMPPEVQDRDADVWEAPLAVADLIGGEWPKRARKAAAALVKAAKEIEPTLGIRLLADLKAIFGDAEHMTTAALLPLLHAVDESPWADIRGKPLDSRGLANRLSGYEIKPKVIRIGEATPRGYLRADLVDAWARYIDPPIPGKGATSATSATSPDLRAQNTHKNGHVADVADVAPLAGMREPAVIDGTCLQCGAGGQTQHMGQTSGGKPIWLHRECVRFWAEQ
jgi:hypothetical protein